MPTATRASDAVIDSVHKALRTALAAQKEAYGDVRTSSTVCTDHLDAAVKSLEAAAQWMAEYRNEETANERRAASPAVPKSVKKVFCHSCENEIDPGDIALCSGCDKFTCPDCMGDDGICKECEADTD